MSLGAVVALAASAGMAESARAEYALSSSSSVQSPAQVSEDAIQGTILFQNTSTGAQASQSIQVPFVRFAPSCAAVAQDGACSTPDPGVYEITSAVGASGTVCSGLEFSSSAPDESGYVTLTRDDTQPVVLGPPGAANSGDRCQINLLLDVKQGPAADADLAQPGTQTRNALQVTGTDPNFFPVGTKSFSTSTVTKDTPAISIDASENVQLGGQITATASLSQGTNPGATIEFDLYGPGDQNCSGPDFSTSSVAVSNNGQYESAPATPTAPGVYRWVARYVGDKSNEPVQTVCDAPNSSVTVLGPPDTTPPDTFLDKTPKATVTLKRGARSKRVKFSFSSSEAGSTFECSLDSGAFEPCTSPSTVKVRKGNHTFRVRAIDGAMNQDGTPAAFDFRVKSPR